MSIKINNQNIVALYKGNNSISHVYKGTDLVWQLSDTWDGRFADPEVGRVLHANGLIANANKSSIEELTTITSLNPSSSSSMSYFNSNKVIRRFPELKYCTGLSSLYYIFYNCSNLTEITIPEGVTNMNSTFSECTRLVEVGNIPNSVTDMNGTFSGCTSLVEVGNIPDSVTSLFSTFYNCRSLVNAPAIPEGVTEMQSTFYGCTRLVEVGNIPNSVTNMQSTFRGCTSLVEVGDIPEGVTDMRATFNNCTNIDGIFIIKPINPPSYTNTFYNVNVIAIYVPDESVDSYKTASRWSNHSSKIKPMSELPE